MAQMIFYLNTDLDVTSAADPAPLVQALEAGGIHLLYRPSELETREDGCWHLVFETDECFGQPEETISVLLSAIEALPEKLLAVWMACSEREFNIGYASGFEPWAFNTGLSCETLRRMAAVGATLRITIYPPDPDYPGPNYVEGNDGVGV